MFNISGWEVIFLLVAALVVLGPEKLPDVMRRAGRTYAEIRKMGQGFQSELRSAFDEPSRELRDTADVLRSGVGDVLRASTDPSATPAEARPDESPSTDAPSVEAPAVEPPAVDPVVAAERATERPTGDADPA